VRPFKASLGQVIPGYYSLEQDIFVIKSCQVRPGRARLKYLGQVNLYYSSLRFVSTIRATFGSLGLVRPC
jgi:hypothetical protein